MARYGALLEPRALGCIEPPTTTTTIIT
eukprot:SAG25_NODE_7280_length_491_cov_0.670918_1_plen_27_part_10